jgi:hypothetical protein
MNIADEINKVIRKLQPAVMRIRSCWSAPLIRTLPICGMHAQVPSVSRAGSSQCAVTSQSVTQATAIQHHNETYAANNPLDGVSKNPAASRPTAF